MFHLPPNKSQNCWPSYLKIQFSIFSIHFWIKCRKWNLLRIQFYRRDDNLASMRNFSWLTQWCTGKIQPNANYFPAPLKIIFFLNIFLLWYSKFTINFQTWKKCNIRASVRKCKIYWFYIQICMFLKNLNTSWGWAVLSSGRV